MNIRKKTLNEVYEYLHNHCGLHTKSDFADILEVKRAGLYSAMNGNESYLTDSLFRKICAKYQGVFDINYLLTGEGTLLLNKDEEKKESDPNNLLSGIENLLEISARQIKENEDLRRRLQSSIDELNGILSQLKGSRSPKPYYESKQNFLSASEPINEK